MKYGAVARPSASMVVQTARLSEPVKATATNFSFCFTRSLAVRLSSTISLTGMWSMTFFFLMTMVGLMRSASLGKGLPV